MKKTILLLTICLLVANISATAQTQQKDNSEWNWAIELQFDDARSFSEGLACVEQNGKWGFIDKTGEWVIKPQFQYAAPFSDGLACAKKNGIGFIDKTGKWVIQPQYYSDKGDFSEGLKSERSYAQWGFVDKTGEWIIKAKFGDVGSFSEGLASAYQNGKWGFIDKIGKWVIPPQFNDVWDFSDGLARAKQNGKWGFIDKTGKWMIQPQFDKAISFSEGFASVYQNGKWGFIDKTGKWMIQPQFDGAGSFSEGLASAYQNGKWGFINKIGKWIIQPQFDVVRDFSEGLAMVKQNGKYGFISSILSADNYIKLYISENIKIWQQKNEFETIEEYNQRMNTVSLEAQTVKIFHDAVAAYKASSLFASATAKAEISAYDSEHRTFLVSLPATGEQFVVKVEEASEARKIKENWENTKIADAHFINARNTQTGEEKIMMAGISLQSGNKIYDSGKYQYEQIVFNNNIAEVDLRNIVPTGDIYTPQTTVRTENLPAQKADVDTEIPETRIKNDKTFAVIIANENYKRESQVEFALNDGKMFREYCVKTLGIPENHIHYETDATLNGIRSEINWLNKTANAYSGEANLIFYYAGHGIPDEASKTAYLLPADGYGSDIQSGYKLDDLYAALGEAPARSVTVFLDACFSGAKRDGSMLASARGISINVKQGVPTGNMIVFTAATNDETAYPYREKGHGMFTYFLLKKLQESKGNVTLGELGDYIATNVKRQSIVVNNKSQTPTVIPSPALSGGWENRKLYQ